MALKTHGPSSWLVMKSMSFKTLLMRSKAYVLIGFLGDFVCPFSEGEELWAKTSLKYGIYWSGTVSAISSQLRSAMVRCVSGQQSGVRHDPL